MKMLALSLLTLALAPAAAETGDGHRGDQLRAFEARKAGKLQPLPRLVEKVQAQLPGWDYRGFDFDADELIYKLIFERDGNVTWIYVDGRTGNTLGRK